MTGLPVGALLAATCLAGLLAVLLSAGETAVRRLGRGALSRLAEHEGPRPARVVRIMRDPHAAAMAAASVRVVLEAVLAVCVTLALAAVLPWWWALPLAVLLVATVALVVVRYVARTLGRRHPLGTALLTSGLLAVTTAVLAPGSLVTRAAGEQRDLTDDEIREMVDRVSESEHIEHEEREMFRSVLELGDTITRAVMVPRTEMVTLPSGTPVRKAMSLFLRSGYSRVPVVGESVDDVLGVLYFKDVVRRAHAGQGSDDDPVDDLLRPAVFVPESKPVDELLREMQGGASHMAMVVDEFGGIAGLVTIEDALEEIVGELTDEHDRAAPEVEVLDDGGFRIPARLALDELGDLFGLDLDDEDVDTAAGLLAKALGKVPLPGSSAEVSGLSLTADRVEGRRKQLATLVVRRAEPAGSAEPGRPHPEGAVR